MQRIFAPTGRVWSRGADFCRTVMQQFHDRLNSQSRTLLIFIATHKLISICIILFTINVFPSFNLAEYRNDVHWPRRGEPVLETYFSTWDGAHYLLLSEEGYQKNSPSCAFFPLWPMMIRAFSLIIFNNHFLTGIILGNILSVIGMVLFHRFVCLNHDVETANASLLLLLVFPGALFFLFPYTESLFLVLTILLFSALFQQRYGWVAVIGFLLSLTDAVGILFLFPILSQLIVTRKSWLYYLSCSGPFFGFLAYLLFMHLVTGNPFQGIEAQKFFPNHPSVSNVFNLTGFIKAMTGSLKLHGMADSIFDRLFFLLLIGCLYPIFRMNKTYFTYSLIAGILPAMSSWFVSYNRHIIVVFPLFILLGRLFRNKKRGLWRFAVGMGILQIWFMLRHVNFIWAG